MEKAYDFDISNEYLSNSFLQIYKDGYVTGNDPFTLPTWNLQTGQSPTFTPPRSDFKFLFYPFGYKWTYNGNSNLYYRVTSSLSTEDATRFNTLTRSSRNVNDFQFLVVTWSKVTSADRSVWAIPFDGVSIKIVASRSLENTSLQGPTKSHINM